MSTFYGSDTACLNNLGLFDVQVTDPVQLIGQRLARRLSTPRGALALIGDDPNFGFDLRQFVNGEFGPTDLANAQAQVKAECEKDEQVSTATVSIALGQGGALTVSIQVASAAGPFALTLNVGQLTVDAIFSSQAAA